jgi:hypothetical protein
MDRFLSLSLIEPSIIRLLANPAPIVTLRKRVRGFQKMTFVNSVPSHDETVDEIIKLHEKGAEVLFARSHTGEQRIKVRYGLLNLRIKRFTVSYQTAVKVKDALSTRMGVEPPFAALPLKRSGHQA